MHGRRAGGAGIFHTGCALKAQIGRDLQHQRGSEILRREASIEVAQHDFIDIFGRNRGIGERIAGNAHDKALNGLAAEFAEWAMRPAYDARGHGASLFSFSSNFSRLAEFWSLFPGFRTVSSDKSMSAGFKHSAIRLCLRAGLR